VAAVNAHSREVIAAEPTLDVPLPHHAAIALVLGYDHRAGEGNAPSRSDTMMLLRTDPATHTISMLSLPRDLDVDVHCHGTVFRSKINAAYSCGNATAALQTVKALTGLPINYLITVNFHGFKKVVNELGGVWVDVDHRYLNTQSGPSGYATINLHAGYQRLTGGAALDYVRFRHTDSDLFRVARQQLFVQAMKDQFKHSFSLIKIPGLVGAITSNVEVGAGGGKRIEGDTVLSYARFIYDLPSGHFFQVRIANLTGGSDLTTDPSNIVAAVRQFSNPDVQAIRAANAAALGLKTKAKAKVPKPAQTTILVLNGNGVEGAAGNAKYLLGQRGYHMIDPPPGVIANAPTQDYFHTKVFYAPANARAKAAAGSLAQVLAPAEAAPITPRIRRLANGAMLVAVVGRTFHNSLTPLQQPPEIKHEPPHVVYNRDESLPYLRDAQHKVGFPLMVPNVIEASSQLSTEEPIRAYTIDKGQKGVRLVFYIPGGNEYWGVEETDWADAPVLAEKNFTRVLKGRRYGLYYHGENLHMVVLHANGATYWVVNTLIDSLSNETMLAIARGLAPLNPPHPAKGHAKKRRT
jgi:LCP family protein required for cell wall assembly